MLDPVPLRDSRDSFVGVDLYVEGIFLGIGDYPLQGCKNTRLIRRRQIRKRNGYLVLQIARRTEPEKRARPALRGIQRLYRSTN